MTGSNNDIKNIQRSVLDAGKWDACIVKAANSRIYGQSFYLDTMAKHWDALVLGDYEAVMPLTWNRKWGIPYLYQPPFTPQLGIFSLKPIDAEMTNAFISRAQQHYKFAEIHLNAGNTDALPSRKNYILSLNRNYESIRAEYKKDLNNNLKEASKNNLVYAPSEDYQKTIKLFIQEYAARLPHVSSSDYERFTKLCRIAFERKMLLARTVSVSNSTELLAIAIFLCDEKRIYNIMSVTLPTGRELSANHFLLDRLIQEFSGSPLILDFEGSEIESIADFYRKFGSVNEPYPFLHYNKLPFPLNYLK